MGRPTPAPQVSPGWPVAGRPGVVFFVRPRFLVPLCQAIAATPSLGSRAELAVVSSQASATCTALLAVTDGDGSLAAGFGMRRPRDGGPPVGYAVVDRTGRVRYRTLDPGVVSGLREVEAIVKALP